MLWCHFSTWTKQMGYPLIKVHDIQQVGNDQVLNLTQEKFWADPSMKDDKSSQDYLWMVPLSFSTSSNPKKAVHEILMDKKSTKVTVQDVGSVQWIKVNGKLQTYYRI